MEGWSGRTRILSRVGRQRGAARFPRTGRLGVRRALLPNEKSQWPMRASQGQRGLIGANYLIRRPVVLELAQLRFERGDSRGEAIPLELHEHLLLHRCLVLGAHHLRGRLRGC